MSYKAMKFIDTLLYSNQLNFIGITREITIFYMMRVRPESREAIRIE